MFKLYLQICPLEHSPSLISQGRIGQLVTSKPIERKSILEEAAEYQEYMRVDKKLKRD